jgi:aminotransferase
MKPLSGRTNGLRQSDIRAVTMHVNRVNGINLGQGICDLPTPEPIREGAIRAIEEHRSIYTSYAGIGKLRAAIVEKVRDFNRIPVADVEEVLVTSGSTGAFVTAISTICESGDEVILFEPFYGYHVGILNLLGVQAKAVGLQADTWEVDFDELEAAVNERTKAIIVCTPANPSGKVWSRDELETLLALLQKYDLWAVTDEIYEYMTYDRHEHVSLASLPGAAERTITISGFSKTFNMTGWRLGYAVAPNDVAEKMGLINDLFYICAPSPLQYGVAEAFTMGDAYYEKMRADYATKRAMLCETLERIGFDFAWPQGAYYVLARFDRLAAGRSGFANDRDASATLIDRAGVATVPGNSFFTNPEDGSRYLRFCFAKEFEVLGQACNQLMSAFEDGARASRGQLSLL